MKNWMAEGSEELKKKKRYVHRHLKLPSGQYDEAGKELLIEFAFQYVKALLTYCSDDIKEGIMCLALPSQTKP